MLSRALRSFASITRGHGGSVISKSVRAYAQAATSAESAVVVPIERVRNIGISAHIDSGKTTLTERILFYTGRISAMHEVRGRDGVGAKMDSMELEREKGITIKSAATFTTWKDHSINIIDTPGHVDFTIEVERALRVLDGAVLVLCAVGGVQSQTMTVDRQMRRYNVPQIAFINKCDRTGSNPAKVIAQVRQKLRRNAVAVHYPMGLEANMEGVVDLMTMEAVYFEGKFGETVRRSSDIPAKYREGVEAARTVLLEALSDIDDHIAEKYLEEQPLTAEEIMAALRKATLERTLTPVMIGTALKNKGVQTLLDGVLDLLPNPTEVENRALDLSNDEAPVPLVCTREEESTLPLLALAFKLEESRFGQLTYMRVYQGSLRRSVTVFNQRDGRKTRVTRLVRMHSDEMEEIAEAHAGEICAVMGLECSSGDSFSDSTKTKLSMASMHVPDPVISLSLRNTRQPDQDRFSKALSRFQREDPTFRVHLDEETREIIISGMGELHLEVYCERMLREYDCPTERGKPKVAFRETITSPVDFNFTHKKQTGGSGQYGKVIGKLAPLPPLTDADGVVHGVPLNEFVNETVGLNIPPQYVPSIEKGFNEACIKGSLTGHPIVGLQYTLQDGAAHAVDSSDLAFRVCARQSVRAVYEKARPQVLEPVMRVEVTVPDEYQGTVMGGLNRRRGCIIDSETNDGTCVIVVDVPLNDMFGYSSELRTQTAGKGEFTMEYLKHQPALKDLEEELIKKYKERDAKD